MRSAILLVLLFAAAPAAAGEPVRLTPPRSAAAVPARPPTEPTPEVRSPPAADVPDVALRVVFAPRSAGLDAAAEGILLKRLPDLLSTRLRILVHATAPAATAEATARAEALALARGHAVRRWLLARRVPPGRVAVDAGIGPDHAADLLIELPRRVAAPARPGPARVRPRR